VFGPPGCGKTHTLLGIIDRLLESGDVRPSDIAFFTFTRNARAEALDRLEQRFNLAPDDMPWCRTIHSAAYRLVAEGRSVMGVKHWKEFAKQFGYALSDDTESGDEPYMPPTKTAHDELRAAHGWLRNRMLHPLDDIGQAPYPVDARVYRLYISRLEAFKAEQGVLDFTDMLTLALSRPGLRPPVSTVFIDEAQDLSPLQQALVTQWSEGCDVYVAGDDDQAIFGFQGANPQWLVSLYSHYRNRAILLEKSYRVPERPHSLAEHIIRRNRMRVPKDYAPRDTEPGTGVIAGGSVSVIEPAQALDLIEARSADPERKTYLLARNWRQLASWRALIEGRGIVYGIAKGSCAVTPKRRAAVAAAQEILGTGSIMSTDLAKLLDCYPSKSRVPIPHGIKAKNERLRARVHPARFAEWGLGPWLDLLRSVGPVEILVKEDRDVRAYLTRALSRYEGVLPAIDQHSGLHLSTIHSSKGQEADTVIVLSDMSPVSHRDLTGGGDGEESENRAAYVAVTRTRDELVIVRPEDHRRAYPYVEYARGAGVAW
jgi:DNA helicase-2/ATP-dependent DNA helicase PcrA